MHIAADSQSWPPMTPKVLATILTIVQWRPRQDVGSFCQDGEDVCASRGRTMSPRRVHPQVEPDSHEERLARVRQLVRQPRQRMAPGLREVQAATQVFRHLAERVGAVDPQGEIPHAIRRQHWSAVHVPLMWAAACGAGMSIVAVVGPCSFRWTSHHCRRG